MEGIVSSVSRLCYKKITVSFSFICSSNLPNLFLDYVNHMSFQLLDSHRFNCGEEMLTIAAMLSVQVTLMVYSNLHRFSTTNPLTLISIQLLNRILSSTPPRLPPSTSWPSTASSTPSRVTTLLSSMSTLPSSLGVPVLLDGAATTSSILRRSRVRSPYGNNSRGILLVWMYPSRVREILWR